MNANLDKRNINFDFSGLTVLVVGGSRGIGRGVVIEYLRAGARVLYVSRNRIQNIQEKNLFFFEVDLSHENQTIELFQKITEFLPIDIFVNSAAINFNHKTEEISLDEWDRVIKVNLTASFLLCKEVIKLMIPYKNGKIINVSSIAGRHRSYSSGIHYVSSKAGLIGLTKQLAFEVAKHNINVNAVCPSQTRTEMLSSVMSNGQISEIEKVIPLGRIAEIEDQIAPILFLSSQEASYITGTFIDVNGGQI